MSKKQSNIRKSNILTKTGADDSALGALRPLWPRIRSEKRRKHLKQLDDQVRILVDYLHGRSNDKRAEKMLEKIARLCKTDTKTLFHPVIRERIRHLAFTRLAVTTLVEHLGVQLDTLDALLKWISRDIEVLLEGYPESIDHSQQAVIPPRPPERRKQIEQLIKTLRLKSGMPTKVKKINR